MATVSLESPQDGAAVQPSLASTACKYSRFVRGAWGTAGCTLADLTAVLYSQAPFATSIPDL